jgi:SAM-dependent methyltransferase
MTDRATRDWNTFGEIEPYFAVLTHDRFLSERMSAADREAFFAFGEADIAQIFDLIDIAPKSALDFGCGVGRLTRALVKRVDRVVGVDAAESMLRIARENVPNATFSTAIPDERFDLIVSLLVFQHIPIRRGEALLGDLLDHLDGVAALHFTFHRPGSFVRRVARQIRGRVPLVHRIAQRIRGERKLPYMQMNEYDLNRVLAIMRSHGCANPRIIRTKHRGLEFAIVIAKKGSEATN